MGRVYMHRRRQRVGHKQNRLLQRIQIIKELARTVQVEQNGMQAAKRDQSDRQSKLHPIKIQTCLLSKKFLAYMNDNTRSDRKGKSRDKHIGSDEHPGHAISRTDEEYLVGKDTKKQQRRIADIGLSTMSHRDHPTSANDVQTHCTRTGQKDNMCNLSL